MLTEAATTLAEGGWSTVAACRVVGVPRSTFYHRRQRPPLTERTSSFSRAHAVQPNALSAAETEQVLAVLTDENLANKSVCQAYWDGFDAGRVPCSQRTFYRIADAHGMVGDRRNCRARGTGSGRAKPVAAATRVNQLWSWDISELRGPGRCKYHLFLAIDVYSRYPVAWRIEQHAHSPYAVQMFTDAFARHGMPQVLHADNGSQMRCDDMAELLNDTVTASHSRPYVSNDNPFSEALFKTIKYDLEMPEKFDSIEHARAWMTMFLDRYTREHRHVGLNRHTPHDVFTGTAHTVRAARQARLDQLHAANPGRYARPPKAPPPPAATGINLSKTA